MKDCLDYRLALALLIFCVAGAVQATELKGVEDRPEPQLVPNVTLKLYSSTRQTAQWFGRGATVYVSNICVASSTGRYVLHITKPARLSTTSSGSLNYSVEFRDAMGRVQQHHMDGATPVIFEGSGTKSADCQSGANASISIRVLESDLLGKVSGEYLDNIQISAYVA